MDRSYYQIEREHLGEGAKIPVQVLGQEGEAFYQMAMDMIETIEKNNAEGRHTVMICPVGPVGQYPVFVRLVKERKVSLKNCWFINMDEYLKEDDTYVDESFPLSFHRFMNRTVYDQIPEELNVPKAQRIFPDPQDLGNIARVIEKLGGVDLCMGGIGINGHLAFNEADDTMTAEEFAQLHTRVLWISRETRTSNGMGDLNGAVDAMPKKAVTIGMAEILSAKKVRLGVFRQWHRAVVRQAAYGEVTAHFPATLLQRHPDAKIYTSAFSGERPF